MKTNQYFLSLDLELNEEEIIQVGIAIGSIDQLHSEYLTRKWYISSQNPISERITDLTGITNEDIAQKGVDYQTLCKELGELIEEYKPFVNPVTWGGGDFQTLLENIKARGINFPYFGRRWIDVKTITTFILLATDKYSAKGLSKTMYKFKLPFEGEAHRADIDAYNTLKFFFHLIRNHNLFDQPSFSLR